MSGGAAKAVVSGSVIAMMRIRGITFVKNFGIRGTLLYQK